MRDFDKQLERYGDELKSARCPYSDAELDREIRSVVWQGESLKVKGESYADAGKTSRLRWVLAAAACLAAVIIPLSMPARANDGLNRVDIDGEHLYFACNNGCSPEGTLETFKTMLVNGE